MSKGFSGAGIWAICFRLRLHINRRMWFSCQWWMGNLILKPIHPTTSTESKRENLAFLQLNWKKCQFGAIGLVLFCVLVLPCLRNTGETILFGFWMHSFISVEGWSLQPLTRKTEQNLEQEEKTLVGFFFLPDAHSNISDNIFKESLKQTNQNHF